VRRSVGTDPDEFKREAVIQTPRDRATHDYDAAETISVENTDAEFTTTRGRMVTMV
jgi:hypothetical protein